MTAAPLRARRAPPGLVPAATALLWSLVVLVGFAVLPFYSSHSSSSTSDGTTTITTSETIIEHEGAGVLAVLLVPVGVAFVGLVGAAFRVPAATIGAAGIATGLCLLGMASIGMFYLPAGLLLVVAAVRGRGSSDHLDRHVEPRRTERRRSVLPGACLGWAVVSAIVAAIGFGSVNDDARVLVGAASLVGPAAAVAAGALLWRDQPRLAGLALVVSVLTPTYAAWALNVPALVLGVGLLATGRRWRLGS